MSNSRASDAVLLMTALVFVTIGLAADVPMVVFLAVGGWLVYYVYSNRRSHQRA